MIRISGVGLMGCRTYDIDPIKAASLFFQVIRHPPHRIKILKIMAYTLKIYEFSDYFGFEFLENKTCGISILMKYDRFVL